MGTLIIESGLVTTSCASVVADLLIEDGRIAAVTAPATLRRRGVLGSTDDSTVLDALGKFVFPAATVLQLSLSPDLPEPRSCSVACWLRAVEAPAPSGNWLPVWHPSPRTVSITKLESTLAEQVWGDGVPVAGLTAARRWRGAEEEQWLIVLGELAAASGVMVVLWWPATSTRRQVQWVAGRLAARGARLLLALEDATQAAHACPVASALAEQAAASVWVASPPPATGGSDPTATTGDAADWWELVRTGGICCLTSGGTSSHLIARLYREGVVSGRIGLTCLAGLVSGWLRRHVGLSPPLTADSGADLVVVDPESNRLADAERVWVDGVPLVDAAGRRERGRALPWPH